MKIKLLSLALAASVLVFSCKKSEVDPGLTNPDEMSAPSGFNYQASRDVEFSVGITDNRFDNMVHVISIYTADPATGGELLSSGSATLITPFITRISLAGGTNSVFVVKQSADGSEVRKTVTFSGSKSSIAIGADAIVTSNTNGSFKVANVISAISVPAETAPACGVGTAIPSNNEVIANGTAYTTSANNITIKINGGTGGSLTVCGNVSIDASNMPNNFTLNVTSTGTVTFVGNMNWNTTSAIIKNFGTVNFPSSNHKPKSIRNFNILNFSSSLTTDAGSLIENSSNGTVTVGGSATITGGLNNDGIFKFNSNVQFNSGSAAVNNHGQMTVTGEVRTDGVTINNFNSFTADRFIVNGNAVINNRCKLIINNYFEINGAVNNYSFINSKTNTYFNSIGNAKLNLIDGAFFLTKDVSLLDGIVTGSNTSGNTAKSLFKATGSLDGRVNANQGYFTGNVQFAHPTVNLTANNKFRNGAAGVVGFGTYIAKNDCNDGNFVDTDGDGVPDATDKYPNDATMAFDHYSENYLQGGSTVAFEDNWPLKGDYDLNDVVISYKYHLISSASNKVVQIKAEYKLLASGGSFNNGAGILFNIPRTSVAIANGSAGTLEAGQDSAVVILFNNSREKQLTWNTVVGEAVSPTVTFSVTLNVTNGPTIAAFGVGNYNPFIWNSSPNYGRGYETHLSGKRPTKLVNAALFKTGNDDSSPNGIGKSYATSQNLPWAIQVPVANFKYPLEKTPITQGYKMFQTWAGSAGASYTDWYKITTGDYRDGTKLY